jgi:hypothetical protein
MEIEINNTPAINDDLVGLKCEHPSHRNTVDCRIRATSACPTSSTVVLTNPDGRLRFPNPADTTATVTVPGDGSWVPFQISGEKGSSAIGDAIIEAHCNTATGDLKAKKGVTVFWFDEAELTLTQGGSYSMVGTRYTVAGGNATNYSAKAKIEPAGVDCSAPQVKDLRVGFIQNALAGIRDLITWSTPSIVWNPGVPSGTRAVVADKIRTTTRRPVTASDTDAPANPLYDRPGVSTEVDPNSLSLPMGCTAGAAATTHDTVSNPITTTFEVDAKTSAGVVVGKVTYQFLNTNIDTDFITWLVIFNTTTSEFCALRERSWGIHVDSAVTTPQKATIAPSDKATTTNPVTGPPFSNDIVNDPANQTTGPVGAGTATFTK